jgi:hypothetical protein
MEKDRVGFELDEWKVVAEGKAKKSGLRFLV